LYLSREIAAGIRTLIPSREWSKVCILHPPIGTCCRSQSGDNFTTRFIVVDQQCLIETLEMRDIFIGGLTESMNPAHRSASPLGDSMRPSLPKIPFHLSPIPDVYIYI